MKTLVCWLIALFSFSDTDAQNGQFVRIFNSGHKKISKGHIALITDSSLQLYKNARDTAYSNIHFKEIGYIKSKRSGWINVMAGTAATAAGMAIAGAATTKPDAFFGKRFAATVLGIIGVPIGAVLGAATIPLNKSKRFVVNGDLQNWNSFKSHYHAISNE